MLRRVLLLVLMLWLPLVTGNAMAQAMLMGMPQTQPACHEQMSMPGSQPDSATACMQCAFCQIACAACLPTPVLRLPAVSPLSQPFPPVLTSHVSPSFPPLNPPPISA